MLDRKTVLAIAAVAAVFIAWLGRYELVAVPAGGEGTHGVVYQLDRWTGHVKAITGGVAYSVKDDPP